MDLEIVFEARRHEADHVIDALNEYGQALRMGTRKEGREKELEQEATGKLFALALDLARQVRHWSGPDPVALRIEFKGTASDAAQLGKALARRADMLERAAKETGRLVEGQRMLFAATLLRAVRDSVVEPEAEAR